MALYADVIVDISHDKLDRTFSYRIPKELEATVRVGIQVYIPFGGGNRTIKGYVVDIHTEATFDESRMKEIDSVVDENLAIEGRMISLASFLRTNYGGTMNQALRTVIPVKKSVSSREYRTVKVLASKDELTELLQEAILKKHVAKERLLTALLEDEEMEYSLLTTKLNISAQTIKAMEKAGVIAIHTEKKYRNPIQISDRTELRNSLNPTQKYIVDAVRKDYDQGIFKTYLIKGITGSGKTEVYLSIIEGVVASGRQVIMLIPEISLTYQTVMRFYRRFGDRVSIMHSRLSAGERFDQYERAKNGEIDIMIGPRSALFTPFAKLGLVVIDEEHEGAYKSESIPKYHAVGVARELARINGASVILGSATPSIDTYYRALRGEYQLFTMNERATGQDLPTVYIENMKDELRAGNRSIISRHLHDLMVDRLQKKEQIMLFINRRGYAGICSCRACGKVLKCPHCDISLSYHKAKYAGGRDFLSCHYCGYTQDVVKTCPDCGSKYIGMMAGGTQKVQEQLEQEFPGARVLRMDMDTTSGKDGHEKILAAFAGQEADILLGTQMIVKGHDFPGVTLMGILAADISLHASDYRAAERTFELLTQAAGRAGRGKTPGEVVIQAYDTENYALVDAAKQDYEHFYNQEIAYRDMMDYPPVVHLLMVKFSGKNEDAVAKASASITVENPGGRVIGPSKASLYKSEDLYHMVIFYKNASYEALTLLKSKVEEQVAQNDRFRYVSVQFDFDPLYT